jgi:hypothetical protein
MRGVTGRDVICHRDNLFVFDADVAANGSVIRDNGGAAFDQKVEFHIR